MLDNKETGEDYFQDEKTAISLISTSRTDLGHDNKNMESFKPGSDLGLNTPDGIDDSKYSGRTPRPSAFKQLSILLRIRLTLEGKSGLAFEPPPRSDGSISYTRKNPFPLEDFSLETFQPNKLFFAGQNASETQKLLSIAQVHLNLSTNMSEYINIQDIETFQEVCAGSLFTKEILAGVFFIDVSPNWKYTIIMNEAFAPNTEVVVEARPYYTNLYLTSGFFGIQTILDQSIVLYEANINSSSTIANLPNLPLLNLTFGQELPILDSFDVEWIELWLPGFFLLLAFMPFVGIVVASMIREKVTNIVRGLTLVGVKHWIYWLHWWIIFSIESVVTAILLSLIWYVINYVHYSSYWLVYIWIQLSCLGIISFTLVITSLTSSEDSSSMIGFLSALFFGVLYIPIVAFDTPLAVQTILSIICPLFGVMQGGAMFSKFDILGLAQGVTSENAVVSGAVYLYVAQTISLITWTSWGIFFRADAPKKHRQRKYKDRTSKETEHRKEEIEETRGDSKETDGDVVVRIQGLGKVFKTSSSDEIRAVDGIDMNIHRNEVYGFLGHNGSGKTTTVSMLSGEHPPSFGDVEYFFRGGRITLSSVDDISTIQSCIGVCPQENIFFDDLTCREHLTLFAKLKGNIPIKPGEREEDAILAEVEQRLEDVKLTSKTDELKPISKFSGGMKRKVSIAIAMIGSPELLILDEATAGMDPYNRRIVWEMIAKAKVGRSILLTTHFMDEADVLSDRIGILNKGKLVARGTSLSLKHEFGVGYHLRFALRQNDVEKVYKQIVKMVPGSCFEHREDDVHYFKLSFVEARFPALLERLEQLGCSNITLQLTTLEEVFLRTGAENANMNDFSKSTTRQYLETGNSVAEDEVIESIWAPKHSDPGQWVRIWAVAVGEMRTSIRDLGYVIFNVLLPLVFLIAGFVAGKIIPPPVIDETDVFVKTMELGPAILVNNIDSPVIFGFPPQTNGSVIYDIHYVSEVPDFDSVDFGSNNAGGINSVNSELKNAFAFNSTVEPAISLVLSALTNVTIHNVSQSLNNSVGVQASLSTIFVGDRSVTSQGINIANLFVPMFTNMGLLPLSYCLLSVVANSEDGIETNIRVMGVTKLQAYLGIIVSRYIFFFLPVFVISAIFGLALQSPVMGSGGRWLGFLLLLITYGYSLVPFALLFVPIFNTKKSAQSIFPPIFNMMNIFPFIVFFALIGIPQFFEVAMTFGDACSIFPPFAYQRGVSSLLFISTIVDSFEDTDIHWEIVWSWEARIWYSILLMITTGTIFWISLWYQVSPRKQPRKPVLNQPIASDGNILDHSPGALLSVSHLTKRFTLVPKEVSDSLTYKTRFVNPIHWLQVIMNKCMDPYSERYQNVTVVNDISFEIDHGEDIVLVGPAGAGKTQLIKTIIDDQSSDYGQVLSRGKPVEYDKLFCNGFMGYCPQFDALLLKLTVEEQIDIVTRIRGLGKYQYDDKKCTNCSQVDALLRILGLDKYKSQRCANLSGGYKRKLSFALAIISSPEVCVFDEPTTGIDPGARRDIWNILNPPKKSNIELPAIIMSTHDMTEAEALATNVAIMINGEMITKGTIPELVEKHCTFFFVEVTTVVDLEITSAAEASLCKTFPSATLISSVPGRIKFKIRIRGIESDRHDGTDALPRQKISNSKHMSEIFKQMETLKTSQDSGILYYSVAEMTLEQIFVALSNEKFKI